ncbi:MAG: tetratricopeptide repeat protein, partial [Alphaproteobacteria bacterium]
MSKLKKFSNYISYLLDDIRDDWKHLIKKGPKRWLRGLFRDLRNSRDSLKDFKVRATAEVSEKEKRRIEKRRLKRRAERIQDMREGLRNLATLPWRLLVGTKKALKAFRKKGIRDGIADLWSGYVSWVMRGVGWFLGLWERFIKLPLWLRGFSATAIIIIIATACTLPWIFEEVQDRRAQEMLAQAREVQDTADLVEAYRKSRAAALMRPDDPEALELVLELSNSVGTPEAIWWSERVSSVRGQDAESMNRVVETALRHRRVEKAEQSFASMKARYPDDENIAEIEVELLIARNKQNEALRRALVALEAGEDSPFLHTTVVELGLKYSTSEFKQRIYEHLLENLYRDDEVGIALARLVFALGIGAPNGKEALLDYNQLISFIETHEQANAVDRAASYSLALRMGNIDRATAEDNILKQFDLEDKDELLTVVRGLGALGLYESYGRIIPEEFIAKEPDF